MTEPTTVGGGGTTVAVVVITYRRPTFVQANLAHLAAQTVPPKQVLIVDASADDRTLDVVSAFPFVTYVRNPAGAGNMTSSRNEALPLLRSTVAAFLDDDAVVEPDYVSALVRFYDAHPEVSLGCSRTSNGLPGEAERGIDEIGVMRADATLAGNFGAAPGRHLPIDHGIGATMHMRVELLRDLGGFREYYTGVSGVREDADLFMRARALGHQAWFVHDAVAFHLAAPQAKGQRFDLRYRHWSTRNHTILLMANLGLVAGRRGLVSQLVQTGRQPGALHKRAVRLGVVFAGVVRGLAFALSTFGAGPRPPVGGFRKSGRPLVLPPAA